MHRGWQDSPVFAKEAYTEREAWLWLIENAVHTDTNINIAGRRQFLKRGQLSFSIRFMAEKWAWDKSRVSRFLNKLEKWDMIETGSETGQLVVSLCNYDEYQKRETETETAVEPEPRQERDSSETKKKQLKTIKTNNNTPIVPLPDWLPEEIWMKFQQHRIDLKSKLSMDAAMLAIGKLAKLREAGHDPTKVIEQSILGGWKGLFELKGSQNAKSNDYDDRTQTRHSGWSQACDEFNSPVA